MTCDEGMELIQRSIDNDLDSQETMLMNDHIRTCPDCAALFDRLTLLSRNLAELPRVTPPFSLVDSILPRLDEIDSENRAARAAQAEADSVAPSDGSPSEAASSRRRNRGPLRKLAGAIAAGLVAGIAIVAAPSLFNGSSDNHDSASPSLMSQASKSMESAAPASSPEAAARSMADDKANDKASELPPTTTPLVAPNKVDVTFSEAKKNGETGGETPVPDSSGDGRGESTEQEYSLSLTSRSSEDSGEESSPTADAVPSADDKAKDMKISQGIAGTGDAIASGSEYDQNTAANAFVMPSSALSWISPDQKYKATAGEQRVSVYSYEDGSLIFQSAVHSSETLSSIYWEEDSSVLHYSWKDAEGKVTDMMWKASTNIESLAADSPK
ncbi:anti-sigma factor [Cohnella sp. AR92]|uniref:anti-sigma factor family protein n=1 Tax=Cohnella sp. AR92 TaxID=648716 RepID=UPI000F8CA265|nr:zf-HC2 domain-containing protein [Cohnella sp. AR92]RUS48550.1 zf-HC2 domain-containing protein [Cohnella sp. AR92]